MSSSSEEKKNTMIKLRSSDDQIFEVAEEVAKMSQTLKNLVDDGCSIDLPIPVTNVSGNILSKVMEYCQKHVDSAAASADSTEWLKSWDAEFVSVDQATLFDLILAANYLNIQSLLDLTCQTVADMIKGRTPEEIRKTFHIKNDFTREEEEEVRKANQWAFE